MCREGCAGKGQAATLEQQRLTASSCREEAVQQLEGCKGFEAGTLTADGQRAWWKLPRGSWRVLRVLSV